MSFLGAAGGAVGTWKCIEDGNAGGAVYNGIKTGAYCVPGVGTAVGKVMDGWSLLNDNFLHWGK